MGKRKSLWIIGNGFDIACFVETKPTSWFSFLSEYLIQPATDNEIITFKNKISESLVAEKMKKVDEESKTKGRNTLHKERDLGLNISWGDVEMKLGAISLEYDLNVFLKCFDDMRESLYNYLKHVMIKNPHIDEYKKLCLKENFFEKVDIDNAIFVVLNYTDYFEKFIRWAYPNKTPTILYPHGSIANHDIVFGVGMNTHILNTKHLNNTGLQKIMVKSVIVDYSSFFPIFPTPAEIHIFGASLGLSDGFIWNAILNPLLVADKPPSSIFPLLVASLIPPRRDNESITVYNLKSHQEELRYKFVLFTQRAITLSKKIHIRQANKRMKHIKYFDTENIEVKAEIKSPELRLTYR